MKLQRIIRFSISMILLCSVFTPSETQIVQADTHDEWWDADWPYRVPVTVEGSGVTSINLNFTQIFDNLGLSGAKRRTVPFSWMQMF